MRQNMINSRKKILATAITAVALGGAASHTQSAPLDPFAGGFIVKATADAVVGDGTPALEDMPPTTGVFPPDSVTAEASDSVDDDGGFQIGQAGAGSEGTSDYEYSLFADGFGQGSNSFFAEASYEVSADFLAPFAGNAVFNFLIAGAELSVFENDGSPTSGSVTASYAISVFLDDLLQFEESLALTSMSGALETTSSSSLMGDDFDIFGDSAFGVAFVNEREISVDFDQIFQQGDEFNVTVRATTTVEGTGDYSGFSFVNDPGGLDFSGLDFQEPSNEVPAPATTLLTLTGIAGIVLRRRRRN